MNDTHKKKKHTVGIKRNCKQSKRMNRWKKKKRIQHEQKEEEEEEEKTQSKAKHIHTVNERTLKHWISVHLFGSRQKAHSLDRSNIENRCTTDCDIDVLRFGYSDDSISYIYICFSALCGALHPTPDTVYALVSLNFRHKYRSYRRWKTKFHRFSIQFPIADDDLVLVCCAFALHWHCSPEDSVSECVPVEKMKMCAQNHSLALRLPLFQWPSFLFTSFFFFPTCSLALRGSLSSAPQSFLSFILCECFFFSLLSFFGFSSAFFSVQFFFFFLLQYSFEIVYYAVFDACIVNTYARRLATHANPYPAHTQQIPSIHSVHTPSIL